MREILFKAKRLDNGEWIEGSLSAADKKCFIVYDNDFYEISDCCGKHLEADRYFEVVPETVCQYTGLTDKNGVKIFEGDKVKQGIEIREVFYGICAWRLSRPNTTAKNLEPRSDKYEIIGNIHDKE